MKNNIYSKQLFYKFMSLNVLPACRFVNHVYIICVGLKATSNPMGLDLQTAVSQHIGAGY